MKNRKYLEDLVELYFVFIGECRIHPTFHDFIEWVQKQILEK